MQHRSGELEMSDGGGTFYGIGFKVFTMLDLNFEYHEGYFSEQVSGSLMSSKNTYFDYLFFSLSLPVDSSLFF